MVRILVEISLPARTVAGVAASLGPAAAPAGVSGRLDAVERSAGCESPARGGEAAWTPCWISLEAGGTDAPALAAATRRLKQSLVTAAREGGLDLFVVAANVQWDDGFYRFRDLLEVADRLERNPG